MSSSGNDGPFRENRFSSSRGSPAGRASLQGNGTAPFMASSTSFAAARRSNVEPTYDFLMGESTTPKQPRSMSQSILGESQSFRQSRVKPDLANEELRTEINTLRYELDMLKQERELVKLQHEKDIRDIQAQADADHKKAQASQTSNNLTSKKYESMARELNDAQMRFGNEKRDLEKKLRNSQDQARSLQEEIDEAKSEIQTMGRQYRHQINEIESKRGALERTLEDLQNSFSQQHDLLLAAQDRLAQREQDVGHLEQEIIRLKAQTGDVETLNIIKRELSDQVSHIKRLEATNREQLRELKRYRQSHRAMEIVEEEKRVLEVRLQGLDDIRRELRETQLRKQILEDERKSWTKFLESEGQDAEFDSPEDVARALLRERVEKASLLDRLGAVNPELLEKDEIIKNLEDDKARLEAEVEKAKAAGSNVSESKTRLRLERQKNLAIKEVEYLRAQLKAFDAEEMTMSENQFDAQKVKQVEGLENLVDDYRKEIQNLHAELSSRENSAPSLSSETGSKRPHSSSEPDERPGLLLRKNRKLQSEIAKHTQTITLLQKELEVTKSQLSSLQVTHRTRILTLASNPTSDFENVKLSTLSELRKENKALLDRLKTSLAESSLPEEQRLVPLASLASAQQETQELVTVVASKEKSIRRLREIFTAKAAEFREAVFSLLGYQVNFLPNGRVRLTSMFHVNENSSSSSGSEGNRDEEEEEEDKSLVFDGESGKMWVSAGPKSAFAREIRQLTKFWVEERGTVPGFLAALTLEFYERNTRAIK